MTGAVAASPSGPRRRRPTVCARTSPARSAWSRSGFGWSSARSAAPSAPRTAAPVKRWWSAGWPAGSAGRRRDGTLLAYQVRVIQDAGAYPLFAGPLLMRASILASGVYAIGRIEASGDAVVTNATPTGPVRGAGRPEANIVIERAVDRFAAEIGMDPAEVRRRNLIPHDGFPWKIGRA